MNLASKLILDVVGHSGKPGIKADPRCECRWRTALVVRELEHEINALALGRPHRAKLKVGS